MAFLAIAGPSGPVGAETVPGDNSRFGSDAKSRYTRWIHR